MLTTILATATIVLFVVLLLLKLYLRNTSGKPSIHKHEGTTDWADVPCIKPDHVCVTTPNGERLHIDFNDRPIDDFKVKSVAVNGKHTSTTYNTEQVDVAEAVTNITINKPASATLRHIHFQRTWEGQALVILYFGIGNGIMPHTSYNAEVRLPLKKDS